MMANSLLIASILFLPLFAAIVCMLFFQKRKSMAGYFFISITSISFILSSILFAKSNNIAANYINFHWFKIGNYNFTASIILDKYSYLMLILVNFITLLVAVFSIEYMHKDPSKHRYFGFIGLFQFSMIGVVLSDNLFQMYFFWELVGFSSYLLIGFWYQKEAAIQASKKAFLMNRIGDICFLIGIFMCFQAFGTSQIESLKLLDNSTQFTIIGLLLFGGCMAKSAQFPLHTWLPVAMEGPTPVSALIHAATMVAAGIYLIIRIFPVFTPQALQIITIIGSISMLMAGVKAILQKDIKKVLAYSTVSQLGLMVVAVGGSAPDFAFNHLLTHAFFKAGLFLSAGSIIHAVHLANPKIDAQNMYLMGGFRQKMPVTFLSFMVCTAAMIGLPVFSGYSTKDAIIEAWYHQNGGFGVIILIALLLSSMLSAIYMSRQVWLIFGGKTREQSIENQLFDGNIWIKIPIIILAICSTFLIGFLLKIPFPHLNLITILNMIMVLGGISLTYLFKNKLMVFDNYQSKIDLFYQTALIKPTVVLAEKIQDFDRIIFDGFTHWLTKLTMLLSQLATWIDTNLIDGLVAFFYKTIGRMGKIFSGFQSGQIQWYFSAMMIILIVIFILAGNFS